MAMKNPPHPGLHVRYDCLEPLKLSVTKGAQALGSCHASGAIPRNEIPRRLARGRERCYTPPDTMVTCRSRGVAWEQTSARWKGIR